MTSPVPQVRAASSLAQAEEEGGCALLSLCPFCATLAVLRAALGTLLSCGVSRQTGAVLRAPCARDPPLGGPGSHQLWAQNGSGIPVASNSLSQ